jgi:SAM-dependent methyltransferase
MFEKYLFDGARVFDFGCGSGRDTKYFKEQGYAVEAIDGSVELCRRASKLTGVDVKNICFQDIEYCNDFDGVWACASLLHVPSDELKSVFIKIAEGLRDNGILYASFKYGDFEGERNGKGYTFSTEEGPGELILGLIDAGFGNTKDILDHISKRKDFKEAVKVISFGDPEEDEDGEMFDMRDLLLNEVGNDDEEETA